VAVVVAWCARALCCVELEVAADTGVAVKAATGRTRPSRANRYLRERVTGGLQGVEVLRERFTVESKG
jgi:hypothetical protein